ncbi:MAG: OsmC family protein [Solirubrobacterales bacterium]|nr:OsmC family protein [Solirubrobacterales bacterium]
MKAIAHRTTGSAFTHRIDIRQHQLTIDEPAEHGGADEGPSPQELLAASVAACTAVTVEMYADRKGWDVGALEVECEYTPAERGGVTAFEVVLRLPADCPPERIERLQVIAAKCPVHRTLDGDVSFSQRVELVEPAPARDG